MTYEISIRKVVPVRRLMLFVKVWIYMKSYCVFMLFSTVCSSFSLTSFCTGKADSVIKNKEVFYFQPLMNDSGNNG